MAREASKPGLRRGWTTGACAAVAAAAAYQALLTGRGPDAGSVRLPNGTVATLPVARLSLADSAATAAVVKDAGDDPDVTDGCEVVATVEATAAGDGVSFAAGEGVGIVTMPGLALAVGEPAINPGPRAIIAAALADVAERHDAAADVRVTVSIPGGAALAEKTLNGRLGIRGGLSILGTTGIVVPYSCASWVHSIHRGIDVARAAGLRHLAAATGSTSEAAVRAMYDLPEAALIDMGDFAGGTLKYLRAHPVERLTLAGGFAKMTKLAQGNLYLHSSKSEVDVEGLAATLADLGAPAGAVEDARVAHSAAQVLAVADACGAPLAEAVAESARAVAQTAAGDGATVDVVVFDRRGRLVGRSGA